MEKEGRRGFGAWVAALVTSDKLEDLPEVKPDRGNVSFLSWLLKSEELPTDPVAAPGKPRDPASRLLASERLPFDEPEVPRVPRSAFLSNLFSREQLPCDPAPMKPAGRRGEGR